MTVKRILVGILIQKFNHCNERRYCENLNNWFSMLSTGEHYISYGEEKSFKLWKTTGKSYHLHVLGPWLWLYGSWIYNYLCNQYHWCEFKSQSGRGVLHYVIKFISDLRQVSGFLRVLPSSPPIKLKYCWKWH